MQISPKRIPFVLLTLAIVVYSVYFGVYQVQRHRAYWTFVDLMSLEQTIWNTLQGRFMRSTVYPPSGEIIEDFTARRTESRLGTHVQPILLLLALPYALIPRSETLLVVMSISVALGAIPCYRLARRRWHSPWIALGAALGYLLLPMVETASGWDIHGTSFLPPLLLAALDAAESSVQKHAPTSFTNRQRVWWWWWAVLAMSCREDMPFLTGWAMLWLAPRARKREAGLMFGLGFAWSLLNFTVIVPHFGGGGTPYLAHFLPPGTEATLRGIFTSLQDLTFWQGRILNFIVYNIRLAIPLLGLYWLHWPTLLAIAPMLLLNGFNNKVSALQPARSHYSLPIVPWLLVGTFEGVQTWVRIFTRRWPNVKWRPLLIEAVVVCVLATHSMEGYTPVSQGFLWPPPAEQTPHITALLATIPPEAPAALEMHIAAHNPQRKTLRIFPDIRDAEWIALNVWLGEYPYGVQGDTIRAVLNNPNWETVIAGNGLLLLRRGSGPPTQLAKIFEQSPEQTDGTLTVIFGEAATGLTLRGVEIVPLSANGLALCTDWARTSHGFAEPLAQVGVGTAARPLAGTHFYPPLFLEPRQLRDCTLFPINQRGAAFTLRLSVLDQDKTPFPIQVIDAGHRHDQLRVADNTLLIQIPKGWQ